MSALSSVSSGTDNTSIGYQAGNNLTTGSFNITIGSGAQVPTQTASNQLSIGNWIYGVSGNIGIGTPTPNQQLEITQAFRFPATTTITKERIGLSMIISLQQMMEPILLWVLMRVISQWQVPQVGWQAAIRVLETML
jgi:hypothetical protein